MICQFRHGLVTQGHMVLLLWHNHTMLGCGFGDNSAGNPIVVCDFAWAHQGHKGDDAWEANLRGRTGATQDECRTIAEACRGVKPAVQFPEFMFEADLVRHAQEMPNPKF